MSENLSKVFLGLDIGTDSVGYALTDENYELKRVKSKDVWGVRLFDEAETAAGRRGFRTARRRNKRRQQRIMLLQELFGSEIGKVDPGFFQRMKDSFFVAEDKKERQPYSLFSDKDFNDGDFHKRFKTIYHLRKALIDGEVLDIRLLYLAIHHIVKYRGHFLFEGQDFSQIVDLKSGIIKLNSLLEEERGGFDTTESGRIIECITKEKLNVTEKKKRFSEILKPCDDQQKEMISLMAGGSGKLSKLFNDESLKEEKSLSFAVLGFEENVLPKLKEVLDDNQLEVLNHIKAIYDFCVLFKILKQNNYLSEALCASFQKHKEDLSILKNKVVKTYFKDKYNEIFRKKIKIQNGKATVEFGCYSQYVGALKESGKKIKIKKLVDKEVFYKKLRAVLKTEDERVLTDENYQLILKEMANGTLLPRQISVENSVMPFQLNKLELQRILQNAESWAPFLKEKIDGIKISDCIMSLLTFKIPYYVGPLNTFHKDLGGYAWAVRKESGKVKPWNFEEKIDVEKSAEEFIKGMTNKCTYLLGENVIPKNSIVYEKFMVLNELNNLKINGEKPGTELKQEIFNNLFLSFKKVTQKKVKDFLLQKGLFDKSEKIELTGIDGDFKSSMGSYLALTNILGGSNLDKVEVFENIILWHTLYEDKKLFKKRAFKDYGSEMREGDLAKITNLSFKGWGRLSEKFLTGIFSLNKETGELMSILDMLWHNNNNLMELLSKNYDFTKSIDEINLENTNLHEKLTYKDVDSLPCSPTVKKQIWQSLKVVAEIVKVSKTVPDKIFVEMARGENEKKERTTSRKQQLLNLYKNIKEEERNFLGEIENHVERDFQSDKLFFYYLQKGKCIYTEEAIDLRNLMTSNSLWDFDHIFPQSKVKDDSLTNRVLSNKSFNHAKQNVYPIGLDVIEKRKAFWKTLLDQGFMSKQKYERLTRTTGFSQEEYAGFIDRQIVETRQTTKYVFNLLKSLYPKCEVISVKGGNVSKFRQDFALVKVREVSNLHHANDAYLNIVVGNAYNSKFGFSGKDFFKRKDSENYNIKRFFEYDIKKGDYYSWKSSGENQTIDKVKKVLKKHTPLISRKLSTGKGKLFDVNPVSKKKDLMPLKKNDSRLKSTEQYGGYSGATNAYYVLIDGEIKGKKERMVAAVKAADTQGLKTKEDLVKYFEARKISNVKVLIEKILPRSIFIVNGAKLSLSSIILNKTMSFNLAEELFIPARFLKDVKAILNVVKKIKDLKIKDFKASKEHDKVSKEKNKEIYDFLIEKITTKPYCNIKSLRDNSFKKIIAGREIFVNLEIEDQCKVLTEIFKLLKTNGIFADLELISGKNQEGNITLNFKLSKEDNIKILNQSVTGLYESVVDVWSL